MGITPKAKLNFDPAKQVAEANAKNVANKGSDGPSGPSATPPSKKPSASAGIPKKGPKVPQGGADAKAGAESTKPGAAKLPKTAIGKAALDNALEAKAKAAKEHAAQQSGAAPSKPKLPKVFGKDIEIQEKAPLGQDFSKRINRYKELLDLEHAQKPFPTLPQWFPPTEYIDPTASAEIGGLSLPEQLPADPGVSVAEAEDEQPAADDAGADGGFELPSVLDVVTSVITGFGTSDEEKAPLTAFDDIAEG